MNIGYAAKLVAHDRVSKIIRHKNDALRDILGPLPPIDPFDPYEQSVAEAHEVLRKAES